MKEKWAKRRKNSSRIWDRGTAEGAGFREAREKKTTTQKDTHLSLETRSETQKVS